MNAEVKDIRDLHNKLIEARKEYESAKPKLEDWLENLNKLYTYGFIIKLDKILSNWDKKSVIKIVGECASGKTTLENIIKKMCPDISIASASELIKGNEYLKHEHILISRKDWRQCYY